MRKTILILLLLNLWNALSLAAQEKKTYQIATIAFYNVENLFDTENDPLTFDDDRTPEGKDHWTEEIYADKLKNIAYAISKIGVEATGEKLAIVGLAEVENKEVVQDLINQSYLTDTAYGIVHFDSPDRRGIDVALLYQRDFFTPTHSVARELLIYDRENPEKRVYTRDQLVVNGWFQGEEITFIVNHWPSHYGGTSHSSYKRELAASLNKKIIDSIPKSNPYAKIITMVDMNDDPLDKSVSVVIGAKSNKNKLHVKDLYNPMVALYKQGIGSLAYRDGWNLFDQIILSPAILDKDYSHYQF